MNWQPIDTAPKDGAKFWAYEKREDFCFYECWWQEDSPHWEGWQCHWDSEADPTHWMPLPAAPIDDDQTPPSAAQAVVL